LARYRWQVMLRTLLAGGGGYVLASLCAGGLALLMPALGWMPRVDAVMTATMLGFVIHAVLAIWVFASASAVRPLVGMLGASALLGVALWWAMQAQGAAA